MITEITESSSSTSKGNPDPVFPSCVVSLILFTLRHHLAVPGGTSSYIIILDAIGWLLQRLGV